MRRLLLFVCLVLSAITVDATRRFHNDVLHVLREKTNAIVQLADPERRMSTTYLLVRDVLRTRNTTDRKVLIVTPDVTTAQQYSDYFKTTNLQVTFAVHRGRISDSVFAQKNVIITPVTNFIPEIQRQSFELGTLKLLVVDDVSTLLEDKRKAALLSSTRVSRPAKTIGYYASLNETQVFALRDLEAIFNGTAIQETQTEAPPPQPQPGGARETVLTLSAAEKQILNVTFPHNFVSKTLGGYTFQKPDLLVRALLHPLYKASQRRQMRTSFEPLDFVGNFVLDFIVSRHILKHASSKNKADMHNMRAQLLRHRSCAYYAANNNFQDYILIDDGQEKEEMFSYVQRAKSTPEVEQATGNSFLHKFFKSVAGAIYVDSGYDPDAVERVYSKFMKADMDRLLAQ